MASTSSVHTLSDGESDDESLRTKSQTLSAKRQHELSDRSSDEDGDDNQTSRHDTKRLKSSHDTTAKTSKKEPSTVADTRPLCQYGKDCYRKNPLHFKEFRHPTDSGSGDGPRSKSTPAVAQRLNLKEKLSHNYFNFLLTHVTGIRDSHNQMAGVHIKEILSPEFGNLVASAQFNFCIDIPWLMQQYAPEFRSKPLLIVHGEQRENKSRLDLEAMNFTNIRLCQAKLELMFGTHHTKMMLLLYDNGLRIVIHTANLMQCDWHQKTQGVWISPLLPKVSASTTGSGQSPTNFKRDLVEYLSAYKASALNEWTKHLQAHDMSSIKVHLIGSIPGRHTAEKKLKFGHMKLRTVLSKHGPSSVTKVKSWPVIGQFSSIGSLGNSKDNWMCAQWLLSLSSTQCAQQFGAGMSNLKLIFPTKENVRLSLEGYVAGVSIPYSIRTAQKQQWLNSFLHQWKCDTFGRSKASPHIKSYARISPDSKEAAWFLVTSANLSKAAWGTLEKNQSQLMIRSYELGVLFLPQDFGCGESFKIGAAESPKRFPVPFDVPLAPYSPSDRPWIYDIPYKDKPDTKGVIWDPC